jgi:hypothetical protein
MLKSFLILFLITLSSTAFGCWSLSGSFSIDGETWKIHNKLEHNQDYILPAGNFILKLSIQKPTKGINTLSYLLHEKKGTRLIVVSKGREDFETDKLVNFFLKGEEGQPNSIITMKLTNI